VGPDEGYAGRSRLGLADADRFDERHTPDDPPDPIEATKFRMM